MSADVDGWVEYDPATHDQQVERHGFDAGREWLEGEENPSADELLNGFESYTRVALPSADGDDLARLRRLVRKGYRAGKADVA